MPFNRSLLQVLDYKPWRWTIEPTYNPDGSILTPGTKQELDGVFIMLSDELVTILKNGLTQAQKDELEGWVNRYSMAQLALWHAPCWAGQNSAVYLRVPASVWNDPTTAPPPKVKAYLQALWREAAT